MHDFFELLMKIGYVVPTDATSLSNVQVVHQTTLNSDGKAENTSKVTIDFRKVNDLSAWHTTELTITRSSEKTFHGHG